VLHRVTIAAGGTLLAAGDDMRSPTQHSWPIIRSAILIGAVTLALSACDRIADKSAATKDAPAPASATPATDRGPSAEIAWARAALQRNPNLEVLATDPQSGVFTVRIKSTGETQAIALNDLAAGPAAQMLAAQPAAGTSAASEGQTSNAATALLNAPEDSAEPARMAAESKPTPGTGTKGYTIERSDGQTRVSGPGVSIVSSQAPASASTENASQRTVDPMICEGHRMLHFDSRSIYVDGDAITARGGCELYITNSRIVAAGTGVVVQDAVVHISNSTIEGSTASFDAGDKARVYLRASTFQGLPRRGERAVVQDQGGNQWR
jgi:hypothetical protein